MVVYVAIVALVMTAIVGVILGIAKSSKYVGALNEIENSAILSLSKISREARSASSTNLVSASSSVSFGTTTIYLNSGRIYLNDSTRPLTSSKVNVSNLLFTPIISTTSKAIKIDMTLNATSSEKVISKVFNTTTVLRGVN